MSLKQAVENKKFTVTSEIGPPKGTNIEKVLDEAEILRGKVDAINVTDLQSSVMKLGSMAVGRLLIERGLEPVFQMTCRDRNRLALQSDLLSAGVLGIKNVLALTGDHPAVGDHPEAKPVYDLDSVQLIQVIKKLNSGCDMKGNALDGKTDFYIGAVVNPCADEIGAEIIKFRKKIDAGAQFFQTQAVYDIGKFAGFMERIKNFKAPILAGLVLLKSGKMAKFMNENVAGISVPQALIDEMEGVSKEDRPKKSVEIAARLIKELKSMCEGVHIMPLGWDRYVPEVLKAAGLD